MRTSLALIAGLMVGGLPSAQERAAGDVTTILGASSRSVWFEKSGTVWLADGARTPIDSRIATARSGVLYDELFVYPGDRVHVVDASGGVTTRMTPVAYDGADLGRGLRVWRRIVSHPDAEFLELFDWNGSYWSRSVSGISDPPSSPFVEAVEVRPDRYLVLWSDDLGTAVIDLFDGTWHGGTGTGTCNRIWRWSRGVLVCAEDGWIPSDAFAWFADFGSTGRVSTPYEWGWGGYQFGVREDSPGRPWVESYAVRQFIPFPIGSAAYPLPGETTHALFWVAGAVFLADATTLGARRIVSGFGPAWAPVPALAGLDSLSLVGEFAGQVALGVRDPATGFEVVAFDPSLGTATVLIDRLAAAPEPGVAFAGGFLFAADDGVHGRELWFSRGTRDSTWLVADLWTGSSASRPHALTPFGEHAAFLADDGGGTALFVLDAAELDWRRSPIDGRYYRLTEFGSWFDATREAQRRGGQLATVRSQLAEDWLWSTFGPQNLWIGLQDLDRNGSYEWVSGEPLAFTAWCPGEPSTTPPDEDVVHIASLPGTCVGRWNNARSTQRYRGLVERTARPTALESFGVGCEGVTFPCLSYGPATLVLDTGWPALGAWITFALDARQDPLAPLLGAIAIGFDNAAWGPVALPLDLQPYGWAPACMLRVAPTDTVPIVLDAHGRGAWGVSIPYSPALRGGTVFVQGLGLSGATGCSEVTNGLRLILQ